MENRQAYYEILRDAFLEKPCEQWLEEAKKLDLPIMRVGHFSDLASDPQAWANGYLETVEFPNGRQDTMPSSPVEMESVGSVPTVPAPTIGADTEQILEELGYTALQIREMVNSGAVRTEKQEN